MNALTQFCFISLMTFSATCMLYSQSADPTTQFQQLLEREWAERIQASPQFATYVGDHRFNDQLNEVGLAAETRSYQRSKNLLAELHKIDRSALAAPNQLNYDLFEHMLQSSMADFEHKTYLFPLTNRSGFHLGFARLPEQVPLQNEKDYRNYIARLNAFGRHTQQQIALLELAIKEGYTLPRIVMDGYETSIQTHIVKAPEESVFFAPFNKFPDKISPDLQLELKKLGTQAITSVVIPAYQTYFNFFTKKYLPACRKDLGASTLPNGHAFYTHLVQQFTTLAMTPEQVHQKGLEEVSRIRAEMEIVKAKTQFKGDFKAFLEFLRTDPQFYAKTADELLKEAAYICKLMDGRLPKLFKKLPRTPYGLKVIPDDIAPKTTGAYYQQPSGDGMNAGFYYLNTYALESRPLYILEALSFHEAVPGHHLQLAYQQELEDVPIFRRFFDIGAFVEGWALYSERLGLELGFYQDPYRDFGRLTYEMWRACRLVVDTGVHAKGWSREQAIQFMSDNTALSTHEITTEVDRYISWPGQALGYKMGEIKIRELRKKAEQTLGDAFDIREFHDQILRNGSIPLAILEKQIENYLGAAAP